MLLLTQILLVGAELKPGSHPTSIQWTQSDGAATVSQGLALGMWQPGTVTLLLSPWMLWSSREREALLKQLTDERWFPAAFLDAIEASTGLCEKGQPC